MKTISGTLIAILLTVSGVQAQVTSNYQTATRQQTIQKGRVLRKKAPNIGNTYHVNNGTRGAALKKKEVGVNTTRNQPMVTKPLAPTSP